MRYFFPIIFVGVLWLSMLPQALATTVVAVSDEELLRRADAVVLGHVVKTETVVHPDSQIFTHAYVQIYKSFLKTIVPDIIVLQSPGGVLKSGLAAVVPGAPRFIPGSLIITYLKHVDDTNELFAPLGLSYGVLHVLQDDVGELRVYRLGLGMQLVTKTGAPVLPKTYEVNGVPFWEWDKRLTQMAANLKKIPKTLPQIMAPSVVPHQRDVP